MVTETNQHLKITFTDLLSTAQCFHTIHNFILGAAQSDQFPRLSILKPIVTVRHHDYYHIYTLVLVGKKDVLLYIHFLFLNDISVGFACNFNFYMTYITQHRQKLTLLKKIFFEVLVLQDFCWGSVPQCWTAHQLHDFHLLIESYGRVLRHLRLLQMDH